MAGVIDLIGQTFGRLTVVELSHLDENRRAVWECQCECGTKKYVRANSLKMGATRSCGCLGRETLIRCNAEKSLRGNRSHPDFETWRGMIRRCSNPSHKDYPRYGGRGIGVCDAWRDDFRIFAQDMGPKPSNKHSIDRIDNDGNYEPGNCRWATAKEQKHNQSRPCATKTHCAHGHALQGDNLLITCGIRVCRDCNRVNARRASAKRRAADATP